MQFKTGANEAAADEITERLVDYNLARSPTQAEPSRAPEPAHVFANDDAGRLIGGVTARTNSIPFWLEISVVWVDETYRGQGLGAELMRQVEREAVARGCRYARLATSHYQAPSFYAKLGYLQYGYLENCPPGEHVTYFWKPLVAESSNSDVTRATTAAGVVTSSAPAASSAS
jgi:GNAT superfamily N-acetyltransferase